MSTSNSESLNPFFHTIVSVIIVIRVMVITTIIIVMAIRIVIKLVIAVVIVIKMAYMGGCQNYGPFLGTLNIRCRIIIGIQKGTIILTTTHMGSLSLI